MGPTYEGNFSMDIKRLFGLTELILGAFWLHVALLWERVVGWKTVDEADVMEYYFYGIS